MILIRINSYLVGVVPLGGVAGGGVEREEDEVEQLDADRRCGFLGGRSGGGTLPPLEVGEEGLDGGRRGASSEI